MSEVYDRARLAELFGDDPGVLAEVERDFLDTARGAEREMRDTDDLRAIARAAHRLKGASGMIGATELGRVAEAVEVRRQSQRSRRRALACTTGSAWKCSGSPTRHASRASWPR